MMKGRKMRISGHNYSLLNFNTLQNNIKECFREQFPSLLSLQRQTVQIVSPKKKIFQNPHLVCLRMSPYLEIMSLKMSLRT